MTQDIEILFHKYEEIDEQIRELQKEKEELNRKIEILRATLNEIDYDKLYDKGVDLDVR